MGNLAYNWASWTVWVSSSARIKACVKVEIKGCDSDGESATVKDVEDAGALLRMIGEALSSVADDYKIHISEE